MAGPAMMSWESVVVPRACYCFVARAEHAGQHRREVYHLVALLYLSVAFWPRCVCTLSLQAMMGVSWDFLRGVQEMQVAFCKTVAEPEVLNSSQRLHTASGLIGHNLIHPFKQSLSGVGFIVAAAGYFGQRLLLTSGGHVGMLQGVLQYNQIVASTWALRHGQKRSK